MHGYMVRTCTMHVKILVIKQAGRPLSSYSDLTSSSSADVIESVPAACAAPINLHDPPPS